MSCGPAAVLLVTVVDAAGTPVRDAAVEVRRQSDGRIVRKGEVELPESGEYLVMDDVSLPLVEEKGTRFVVEVRRAKQRTSVVLRIGKTADGCHIRHISGATRLTLT